MRGLHLIADLRGCSAGAAAMTDAQALRALCRAQVAAAGLQTVGELFHGFAGSSEAAPASGVTGVVLLAESHVAIHTWPELGAVTLDVYVCNVGHDHSRQAEALMAALIGAFGAAEVEQRRVERGRVGAPA